MNCEMFVKGINCEKHLETLSSVIYKLFNEAHQRSHLDILKGGTPWPPLLAS